MTEPYDVAIIGAGPGGYVAAIRAAQLGLKTVCIEKRAALGGTCLNVGCIPSKALLHSSELYWKLLHESQVNGIQAASITADFPSMMARKDKIIAEFNAGIQGLFKKHKITHLTGTAEFLSPHTLQVVQDSSSTSIEARYLVLATGSEPVTLPFLPFDEKKILSSTGALALNTPPRKLLVIGAGVIGVELGSVYSRLGSEVTFVEFLDRICPTLDPTLSKELQRCLTAQGMQFRLDTKVVGITPQFSILTNKETFETDAILVAIGRKPMTASLKLDKIGIVTDAKGFIPIDGQFRTTLPHIFAIGDIVDGPMLAHKASEEGVAVAEIIAGHSPHIQYAAIPNVVYTEPEVASVGLTEPEAKQAGLNPKIGLFVFKANSRAKCTGEENGFVKLIADEKTDRIIGVHIIGAHASELISEAVIALSQGMTARALGNACHPHPTLSEALKEAALAVHNQAIHR